MPNKHPLCMQDASPVCYAVLAAYPFYFSINIFRWLQRGYFSNFSVDTLIYIFYSMPKNKAQLYAANELCNRGWFYHKEHWLWFTRVPNMDPRVITNTYERGCYHCFDPNTFEIMRKDNFVLHCDMLKNRLSLPQH